MLDWMPRVFLGILWVSRVCSYYISMRVVVLSNIGMAKMGDKEILSKPKQSQTQFQLEICAMSLPHKTSDQNEMF